MHREHRAGAGVWVSRVLEQGFRAGRDIDERQRIAPAWQVLRRRGGVIRTLLRHPRERHAFRLGFQRSAGATVQEQDVVGRPGRGRHLPHGDAGAGMQVQFVAALHGPAGAVQHGVDPLPCAGFGGCCDRRGWWLRHPIIPAHGRGGVQSRFGPSIGRLIARGAVPTRPDHLRVSRDASKSAEIRHVPTVPTIAPQPADNQKRLACRRRRGQRSRLESRERFIALALPSVLARASMRRIAGMKTTAHDNQLRHRAGRFQPSLDR
jgi:hypothetical protein